MNTIALSVKVRGLVYTKDIFKATLHHAGRLKYRRSPMGKGNWWWDKPLLPKWLCLDLSKRFC